MSTVEDVLSFCLVFKLQKEKLSIIDSSENILQELVTIY